MRCGEYVCSPAFSCAQLYLVVSGVLYTSAALPQGSLAGRMSGSQSPSGRFGKEKDLLLLSAMEICSPNNFCSPRNIIAAPTVQLG